MIELRSYRRVFDLERRIYDIDRLRLNPNGVPVRGVVYFLALLAIGLVAAAAPLLGAGVRLVPWYLRDIALPGMSATLLSAIRIEGRVFHLAAHALARYWLGPRRLAGAQRCRSVGRAWRPGDLLLLPDGSDARMRSMRYTGPGAVRVAVEHDRSGRAVERGQVGTAKVGRRPVLTLSRTDVRRSRARDRVIVLGAGARLRVRAGTGRGRSRR